MNEVVTNQYQCKRLAKTVYITLPYEPITKICVDFDCDSYDKCDVRIESRPGIWHFDWSKCEHPNASNR